MVWYVPKYEKQSHMGFLIVCHSVDNVGGEEQESLEGLEENFDQAIDMVKIRVVWWFKHHGKGSKDSITSLLLNIKDCCVENKIMKQTKIKNWVPPTANSL